MMAMRNVTRTMTMMMFLVSAGVVRRTFFSFFQPAEQQPEQRPRSPKSVSTLQYISRPISEPHQPWRYNVRSGHSLFWVIRHKLSFSPITEGNLCWPSFHGALLVAADAGNPTLRVLCKVSIIQRFILTVFKVNEYLNSKIILSLIQLLFLFCSFYCRYVRLTLQPNAEGRIPVKKSVPSPSFSFSSSSVAVLIVVLLLLIK